MSAIAPAAIDTQIRLQQSPDAVRALIEMSPTKRLGTVDEVSDVALWLCAEACSFNTGATFDVI